MWSESIASRGSQEIGSSILKYLELRASDATHLIVFSDACGGQNRHINIACLWMYVLSSSDIAYTVFNHKCMVSAHSYLPNDRDFGSIEHANRHFQQVFVPEEWCTLVERARTKNPFHIVWMEGEDQVSMKAMKSEVVHRKVNTRKEKVDWLSIRWLQLRKDNLMRLVTDTATTRWRPERYLMYRENGLVDRLIWAGYPCNRCTTVPAPLIQ